jgi:hypothetical protein
VELKKDPLPRDGPLREFQARVGQGGLCVEWVMLTCSCHRFVPNEITEACTKLYANFLNVEYMVNITESK